MAIPSSGRIKAKPGQLILRQARERGGSPDIWVWHGEGVPRCDSALIMQAFCNKQGDFPILVKELEDRGYDLSTLRFSISKASASDA